jgi:hypothetical protein
MKWVKWSLMGCFFEMVSWNTFSLLFIHSRSLDTIPWARSTYYNLAKMTLVYLWCSLVSLSFSSFFPVMYSSLMLLILRSISSIYPKLHWLN